MRDWRKLHKAILSSDRMPECSFEALWLWTLLTVAQDDLGRHPWTRAKVQLLIAPYGWGWDKAKELADELVMQGIADFSIPGFIHLVNGEVYNGKPTESRRDDLYPQPDNQDDAVQRSATLDSGTESQCLDARASGEGEGEGEGDRDRDREDALQSTASPRKTHAKPAKRVTDITEDFEAQMVEEYSDRLGGPGAVRDEIAAAKNHKAGDNAKDKRQYLRTWLNRSVRFQEERRGTRRDKAADTAVASLNNSTPLDDAERQRTLDNPEWRDELNRDPRFGRA